MTNTFINSKKPEALRTPPAKFGVKKINRVNNYLIQTKIQMYETLHAI